MLAAAVLVACSGVKEAKVGEARLAYADGTYHFPVPPSLAGGHVRLYGDVHTDLGQYGLAIREVELSAGETITNDWTIDLDGTIGGDAVITGVTVDQIYIYGYGPHGAYRNLTLYTPGEYLLGVGVVHVTTGPDNGVNSALLLDNARLDPVPEPASFVVLGLLALGVDTG